jgi:membrane protein required for colicin V production
MNTVDYLLIATVVICSVVGLLRGFLREIIALLAWIIGLLLASLFASRLEPYLGGALATPEVRPFGPKLVVLGAVLTLGAGLGTVIAYFVRLSLFIGMDRFLGFLFGLLRGILIIGVAVLFCELMRLSGEHWWHTSLLLPYGERVASLLRPLLG